MIKQLIKNLVNKRIAKNNRACINQVMKRIDDIALDILQNEEIHIFVKTYMNDVRMTPHLKTFRLGSGNYLTSIEVTGRNPEELRLRLSVFNITFLKNIIYPEYKSSDELINKGFKISGLFVTKEAFFFTAQPLGNTLALMTN